MTDDQLGLIFAAVALPDDWQDRTAHPVTEGTDVVDGQMLEGKRKRIVRAFLDGNIDEPAYSVGRPKSTSKSRGQPPAWSSPLSRRRHGGVGGDGGESNSPSREGPARGPTGVSGGWFSSGGPSPARRHRIEPMSLRRSVSASGRRTPTGRRRSAAHRGEACGRRHRVTTRRERSFVRLV